MTKKFTPNVACGQRRVREDGRAALHEYHDAAAGIRRGLAQARKGLGRSVDEVFDAIDRDKKPLPTVTAR